VIFYLVGLSRLEEPLPFQGTIYLFSSFFSIGLVPASGPPFSFFPPPMGTRISPLHRNFSPRFLCPYPGTSPPFSSRPALCVVFRRKNFFFVYISCFVATTDMFFPTGVVALYPGNFQPSFGADPPSFPDRTRSWQFILCVPSWSSPRHPHPRALRDSFPFGSLEGPSPVRELRNLGSRV